MPNGVLVPGTIWPALASASIPSTPVVIKSAGALASSF